MRLKEKVADLPLAPSQGGGIVCENKRVGGDNKFGLRQ